MKLTPLRRDDRSERGDSRQVRSALMKGFKYVIREGGGGWVDHINLTVCSERGRTFLVQSEAKLINIECFCGLFVLLGQVG